MSRGNIQLFYCYAREDEQALETLVSHLEAAAPSSLRHWYDRKLMGGDRWRQRIEEQLARSDLVVLLVSNHFYASSFITEVELPAALRLTRSGRATVVPVLLAPTEPFRRDGELQQLNTLPTDARAVSEWQNPEEAWVVVARSLLKIVGKKRAQLRWRKLRGRATRRERIKLVLGGLLAGAIAGAVVYRLPRATADVGTSGPVAEALELLTWAEGARRAGEDLYRATDIYTHRAGDGDGEVNWRQLRDLNEYIARYNVQLKSVKERLAAQREGAGRLGQTGPQRAALRESLLELKLERAESSVRTSAQDMAELRSRWSARRSTLEQELRRLERAIRSYQRAVLGEVAVDVDSTCRE